jgi:hypothetical protein
MSPTMNRLAYGRIETRRLIAIYAVGIVAGCLAALVALTVLGVSLAG